MENMKVNLNKEVKENLMRIVMEEVNEAIKEGNSPFGAILIDELIEDIVIEENRNIKVIFKCEDKYFEALDFIKRQNYDIISSS